MGKLVQQTDKGGWAVGVEASRSWFAELLSSARVLHFTHAENFLREFEEHGCPKRGGSTKQYHRACEQQY
ncbi:hypothetical protein MC885_020344 [Smutsia gigantea]|nr:hypothetical protein MC885_020344 [Smutsia gigantea]